MVRAIKYAQRADGPAEPKKPTQVSKTCSGLIDLSSPDNPQCDQFSSQQEREMNKLVEERESDQEDRRNSSQPNTRSG